ncbi:hypothetical protein JCM9279_003915 [Rhodotorula babjevae]
MAQTPPPADTAISPAVAAADTESKAQSSPAWTTTYDGLAAKLPVAVSSRLPSSSAAATAVASAQDQLSTLSKSSKQRFTEMSRTASQKAGQMSQASKEQWLAKAWSVTNETQIPLNVALCQVGPLYYEVLAPEATFERRVPNLWFSLEVRPYTAPSTAYNAWSTTWPVLAITGPAVAVTSLLAIPFVAVAAGGTALASLTSIGSSIASGAAGAAESAAATAAAAAGFAAKASRVPGAGKVKGKLADAAKDLVGERLTPDKVQQHVVRYLAQAGGAGAAAAGAGAAEGQQLIEGESEEAKVRRVKKEKKLEEVDVTGHDLEKVLKCETGHSATDKALAKAFKRLSFKTKFTEYRTDENPVLRIAGGPELETRTAAPTFFHPDPVPRQVLVFYPFVLLHSTSVSAQPLGTDEAPLTEDERRVMSEARVVESYEEAEKVTQKAPSGAAAASASAIGGEGAVAGADASAGEKEAAEAQVDQAVEDAKQEVAAGEAASGDAPAPSKKKGWLW